MNSYMVSYRRWGGMNCKTEQVWAKDRYEAQAIIRRKVSPEYEVVHSQLAAPHHDFRINVQVGDVLYKVWVRGDDLWPSVARFVPAKKFVSYGAERVRPAHWVTVSGSGKQDHVIRCALDKYEWLRDQMQEAVAA